MAEVILLLVCLPMVIVGSWMLVAMERESRQSTVYHVSDVPPVQPFVASSPAPTSRPRLYVLPPLD